MNEVYISGFVSGNPVLRMEKGDVPHFIFSIDIQHKTKSGILHHELYTVNAWHNTALRASERLRIGQYVMLRAYLSQKLLKVDELSYMLTELTVKDFVSSANVPRQKRSDFETRIEGNEVIIPVGEACEDAEMLPEQVQHVAP